MKSLVKKLLAFTFAIALFTGCASVTDSALETAPETQDTELTQDTPDRDGFGTDQEMSTIVDKPE
ncbi:hypothetical protein [Fodinibius halophilus]|uniref:Secreted protein n=1 Tax=Fodinibius halophilus TaxID=1736908 RepID=A0A6M1TDW9_9BACT|nr:hypothetical protein [Fodinibius halophilus]NGP88381.1 hypothetical protein [Fodinibius halophilus]NGP88382.1 hypothetical protein [Fodinibius halophilus]